jgi:hypothetical protein
MVTAKEPLSCYISPQSFSKITDVSKKMKTMFLMYVVLFGFILFTFVLLPSILETQGFNPLKSLVGIPNYVIVASVLVLIGMGIYSQVGFLKKGKKEIVYYVHNLRKRILVAIGANAAYYLINLPYLLINGFFNQPTLQNDLPDYFIYNVIKFGTVSAILYVAFIVVKPSLFPKSKKYKQLIILIVILIPTSVIALQSGYIIPELEQGLCITHSGTANEDGNFIGGRSQGISTESECNAICDFNSKTSMGEDKLCEFHGVYGKTDWIIDPNNENIIFN